MAFQSPRGTTDLLADELARASVVERTARRFARVYGYQEIRTPIMEESALFQRSVGETSDIVQKEMFQLMDRGGGHDMVLRPEGTAPVVRAYLQHNLHKTEGFAKLFYLGPMFRAERPQAGRLRQFHQYGVEAIGSESSWVDVEVIELCVEILRACGVRESSVWLSTMGCLDDQQRTAEQLRQALAPYKDQLCKDCQARFDRNIFRVLDCKQPGCQEIVRQHTPKHAQRPGYPPTLATLCDACAAHFDEVRRGLREVGVAFDDTQVFARGLDYYTRTVFEVKVAGLGAQDTVAAGGRYNRLVEELGGPATGAVGFAAGIERVLNASALQAPAEAAVARDGSYVAVAQPALVGRAFRLVHELRQPGVVTWMDYEGRSLKSQMREADKLRCRWFTILGERELAQGKVAVKDLDKGEQREVALTALAEELGRQVQASAV